MAYPIQDRSTLMMTPLQRRNLTEACETQRANDEDVRDNDAPGPGQLARGTQRLYVEPPPEQLAADAVVCLQPSTLIGLVSVCTAVSALVGVVIGAAL